MAKAQIDEKFELDQNFDEIVKQVNAIAKKLGPKFTISLEDRAEQQPLYGDERIAFEGTKGATYIKNYRIQHNPIIILQYLTPMGGQFAKLEDKDIAYALEELGKDLTRVFEDKFIVGKSHVRLELPYENTREILTNAEAHSRVVTEAVKKYETTVTVTASKKSGQSHADRVNESATDKMIGLSKLR